MIPLKGCNQPGSFSFVLAKIGFKGIGSIASNAQIEVLPEPIKAADTISAMSGWRGNSGRLSGVKGRHAVCATAPE